MEATQALFGEKSPLKKLLSSLSILFLDDYVLDIITDPALLTKLLITKVGSSSQRAIQIKVLRRVRNNIEHGRKISPQEEEKYYRATAEVRVWVSSEVFQHPKLIAEQQLCLQYCNIILESEGNPLPPPLSPPVNTPIPRVSSLQDLKANHKEAAKGKYFLILEGHLKDTKVRLCKWNGNNCMMLTDDEKRLYVHLSVQVQLI